MRTIKKSGKILSLRQLIKQLRAQSSTMRRKLLWNLFGLILVGSGILFLVLLGLGAFTENSRSLTSSLSLGMDNCDKDISERLEFITGSGLNLSERIAASLEREILTYPYDIRELENDVKRLNDMQKRIYPLLESSLNLTRTSGAFAVFDTTVNTESPGDGHSRTGVYLRVANVSSGNALENDIFLFRGSPELAVQNHIQLHNRWNMEFNIEHMDWYDTQLYSVSDKRSYLCIDRHRLKDTWENGVFLSMPVIGSGGERYGLCGLEVSSLLFTLNHPVSESKYGDMIEAFIPVDGENLVLSGGLLGEPGESYLDDSSKLTIQKLNGFNTYRDDAGHSYFGMHRIISGLNDSMGRQWAAAVLLPAEGYLKQTRKRHLSVYIAVLIFFLTMLTASFFIAQNFVKPIVRDLEVLKTDNIGERVRSSNILEIEELAEFLRKMKEENQNNGSRDGTDLPPNIKEIFDSFIEKAAALTVSERNILRYYIRGYEIADIPGLAYISVNTVKKHNRSIYKKLGVNSKDELTIYLDLLKRCKRIEELEQ